MTYVGAKYKVGIEESHQEVWRRVVYSTKETEFTTKQKKAIEELENCMHREGKAQKDPYFLMKRVSDAGILLDEQELDSEGNWAALNEIYS